MTDVNENTGGMNSGEIRKNAYIDGAVLKWAAIVSMLIDHFGAAVLVIYTSSYRADGTEAFSNANLLYHLCRNIGRTAFPVFCFLIVEGFFHTKHLARYIGRVFVFCILSEIPFDLAVYNRWCDFTSQNVYWTLLLGLLAMTILEWAKGRMRDAEERMRDAEESNKTLSDGFSAGQRLILIGIAFLFMAAAYFMQTDYDISGVALILIFYLFYHEKATKLIVGYVSMIWEYWCFPGFILMYFYNGKRGRQPKYFFYLFYPCHLFLLYMLRLYLLKR